MQRRNETFMPERTRQFLSSRWGSVVCGVITAVVTWCAWGSLNQIAAYHDEAAYLLQAGIFASGRWTAAARPLPEFFEQYHVLVTPVLASKYWPGHSLLMVPGVWLGLPGLVPVLLSGLAGALCFALARRVAASPWVALVTWLFWTSAPGGLYWRASYFSEITTSALWLVGWWALLDWYETGRRGALLALSACIGWSAITRPLTALVYAIPAGVVVFRRCRVRRAWRDLGLALAVGAVLLGLIPLWSARTTGDWRTTPYALYARQYFPFTLAARPERALPPDMQRWVGPMNEMVRSYALAAVPVEFLRRIRRIGDDLWHGWRAVFLPFAILAVFALPMEATYAIGTMGLLVLSHLVFAHAASWSLYYLEVHPVLAFLTALGLAVVARRVAPRPANARPIQVAALLLCCAALWFAGLDLRATRRALAQERASQRAFAAVVHQIPHRKAIVFVRYGPRHNVHASLIVNEPDLMRARAWIVYDRGLDNTRLLALAPDRVPYMYDEATNTLTALPGRLPNSWSHDHFPTRASSFEP